jgi:hypothetical protein
MIITIKFIITSSNQTFKKTTIIFVKVKNKKGRKGLRVRGGYECEDDKGKKIRERSENIIYTRNSSYLYWVIRVRLG